MDSLETQKSSVDHSLGGKRARSKKLLQKYCTSIYIRREREASLLDLLLHRCGRGPNVDAFDVSRYLNNALVSPYRCFPPSLHGMSSRVPRSTPTTDTQPKLTENTHTPTQVLQAENITSSSGVSTTSLWLYKVSSLRTSLRTVLCCPLHSASMTSASPRI